MPSTAETLTDVVHSSKQIKVQGFSVTAAMAGHEVLTSGRWKVGGYDWEVRTPSDVNANFSCRLIDPSGKIKPSPGISSTVKLRSGECRYLGALMSRRDLQTSGYLNDDAFTVEYTLKVLRELRNKATAHRPADHLLPSSGLNHHLGELLRKGTGADVTLVASGESFKAHKAVLASRSLVFAAEFFGHMKEARSPVVEIEDMDAAVLGAMLRFIYTDTAPELDRPEDGAAHLLVAADRYSIDRLKLVCEDRLYDGVNVETAAATLALAEQHGCSHLKAKCVELIAANLEAAMATEGYSHLMASCPSVMNDLLRAVHGRKN
ncbi:LOW QUALITY PROTEIN: hypothetical protein GQ55_4G052800 [Panicum hallii var. hallii]|uniref:BTB domain-containing protein n=1 Tax=Panicum hallii var. hallii TaxID=1504633 RepID=A0A2T7DVH3_9POAL|nr:LOW QUALITY PROTEIN: hypothetical protein GQ55_4G052800 [Panicum hallii var. hallii]